MTPSFPPAFDVPPFLRRIMAKATLARLVRAATIIIGTLALASGIATYVLFADLLPFAPNPRTIVLLIYADIALMLLIGVLVIRKVVKMWLARRRGSAGSRMHARLAVLFGALSVIPAIFVSAFSLTFFNMGLESWFSERVRTALSESSKVAEAYLLESRRNLRSDAIRIARDLSGEAALLDSDLRLLQRALVIYADLRGIEEALVFSPSAGVRARAGLTYVLELERIPTEALKAARRGEAIVLQTPQPDRVHVLVRINNFMDENYLLVGSYVDPDVLVRVEGTRNAVEQFEQLERERSRIQISFALSFILVAFLLLLVSAWIGLGFASLLTEPIGALIAATEKVAGGNMSIRVPVHDPGDELGMLGIAFNRMTGQLETQRKELVEAAKQIDERRRFSETVLTGVTSGVIGLDAEGGINLPNRAASELLETSLEGRAGEKLEQIFPELTDIVMRARLLESSGVLEEQIAINRPSGLKSLLVRVAAEWQEGAKVGYVVTFDDLSDLLKAQRQAAWADVARRIAHEIKNPLTPIQLAADRLKRKYLGEISSDPETFSECTDTIIRQVDNIGRMVSEFSDFARMPKPVMRRSNLSDLCRQAVFMQRNANPHIEYETHLPDRAVEVDCDARQISQALTNLLTNAGQAIEALGEDMRRGGGRIRLYLQNDAGGVSVTICDNGGGLPEDMRARLMEPYVTTREQGSGLGLAIVGKIMEDHGGALSLDNAPPPQRGAVARLQFAAPPCPGDADGGNGGGRANAPDEGEGSVG